MLQVILCELFERIHNGELHWKISAKIRNFLIIARDAIYCHKLFGKNCTLFQISAYFEI